jgi:hypothetical protein
MHSLPPAVLFNEQTGRLELCHPEIARRVRRTHRLRSRYRSLVFRRLIVRAFRAPWRAAASFHASIAGPVAPSPSPTRAE